MIRAAEFPGVNASSYRGIIDAYHGETGRAPSPQLRAALARAWQELLDSTPPADYANSQLYDKNQPLILRKLAADKLFRRLSQPAPGVRGVQVSPDEVIVAPYSSMVLLEEAVATLASPGGVIVCPEGFYKSNAIHVEKHGLRMITCPARPDSSFKIDPATLAQWLHNTARAGKLRGVLLTMPGNPVTVDYSLAELQQIGQALAASGAPVICDMAFDQLVDDYVPIAALTANNSRLYDQILSITGNSKGYSAFGPCKFGAACTGNREWLDRIRSRLTIGFQRETTHVARATLEHTSDSDLVNNRVFMYENMQRAQKSLTAINDRIGSTVYGVLGNPHGLFLSITIDRALARKAKIRTAAELEDLLLAAAGIDTVGLDRTGSTRIGVRLNVLSPRKAPGQELVKLPATAQAELFTELFDRLEHLGAQLLTGLTYPAALTQRGVPVPATATFVTGVVRETRPGETRVALTPNDVLQLTTAGTQLIVERNAGAAAGYDDCDYAMAGAFLVSDAAAVSDRCDVVAALPDGTGGTLSDGSMRRDPTGTASSTHLARRSITSLITRLSPGPSTAS